VRSGRAGPRALGRQAHLAPGLPPGASMSVSRRPRAREAGLPLGTLEPGPGNAITDVGGVRVGQTTLVRGERIRTGVTAIVPREGDLLERPVAGAIHIGNAFGKLVGSTQVEELGEIETPILLTSTLNVPRVADAVIDYVLESPGHESVISVNPLVAETNDGRLNDGRARSVGRDEVFRALQGARAELPEEGAVGAGTGTIAFGFKGGIGTSSRRLPASLGGHTLGVLVQSNYGGLLTITGVPVGSELGPRPPTPSPPPTGGSVVVVVATDAPIDARNLRRLGSRAMFGIARTGADGSNRSGDYVIAFSNSPPAPALPNRSMDPLFGAVIEATEEAVYNSLFRAETMTGCGRTVEALPIEPTLDVLRRHGRLPSR
jgi:D-aminopeptidase